MLWTTAAIWGFAFVAQRAGMQYMGPFTFNGIRFALGSLSLLPLLWFRRRKAEVLKASAGQLLKGGLIAGIVLFFGASLQQAGMLWTSAGKAGFITGFYIILVPLIGLFIGQVTARNLWLGGFLALAGLFLLTVNSHFTIQKGDFLVLMSAVFWAIHVQLINRLVVTLPPLPLSAIQFATCSILSLTTACITEPFNPGRIYAAAIPLLYGGFMSVGIAYTLQVFAQRHVHPAYASLVLSFETVFAALGGWIILNEKLSFQNLLGCLLMLSGFVLVQLRKGAKGPKKSAFM